METVLANLKTYFRTVPKNKLYLYVMILVLAVGGSVIGLSFLQKEDYQPLFAGLSTEDASMIVAKLKEQKISYRLGVNGTTVSVPKERLYDVRLLLASQNSLPGGGGVGLELFDKTNYGMTEFMQSVNYKRAIQGELTRTINQMPEIRASRVHIAIPEKTLFTDREKEVTASVFLKLKQGRELSREQVNGIVQLVAGSIEGLKAENVVVIDSSGKILHKNGDASSELAMSGQQYELQRAVEKKIEESVQSMLETFLMSSRSVVRASVELNLRKVEKTEEEYSPDKTVVSGEKKTTEKAVNSKGKSGGVPGAAAAASAVANKTQKQPGQKDDQNLSETQREDVQVSYEVSKTVSKIVEPFGDIKHISLAVLVDGKYEKVKGQKGEELKYIPRSQQELNNIRNLVLRAAGFNEERGDKIEVLNMPFEVENVPEEKTILGNGEGRELVLGLGKYVFYSIILVCVFLFGLKPFFKLFQEKNQQPLQLQQVKENVPIKTGSQEPTAIAGEKAQARPAISEALKDKALVGSIIREWVKENP
ncbi:MAG: flagellar basal-body MS-ring/collar protein FliF [Syntrophorhabdales bacterium]